MYRLGFEVCELSGETVMAGPTGYPVAHSEWERLRAAVDAFYASHTPDDLSGLQGKIAADREGAEKEDRTATRAAESEAARWARAGYVYLLVAETGEHKIGFAREVSSRVCRLGTQTPYRLALVHSFYADDARGAEKELHRRFKSKRIRGEWFALSAEDVAWFKSLKRGATWRTDSP